MLRRSAKLSVRLGLLVLVAVVIKKILDGRGQAPVRLATPPAPPKPAPAARQPTAPEPAEPEPAARPEPTTAREAAPTAAASTAAADKPQKPAKKAARKAAKKTTKKAARKAAADGADNGAWVEPDGDVCPPDHPIKVKLRSKVFRRPGGPGYDTSRPDRCYASAGAASRAGFTEAQR